MNATIESVEYDTKKHLCKYTWGKVIFMIGNRSTKNNTI